MSLLPTSPKLSFLEIFEPSPSLLFTASHAPYFYFWTHAVCGLLQFPYNSKVSDIFMLSGFLGVPYLVIDILELLSSILGISSTRSVVTYLRLFSRCARKL